jgi:hypothetical protein
MKRKIEFQTAHKEQIAAQLGGDIRLSNKSDFQSRSHRIFCVIQGNFCPHGAWGRGLNKHKKPPAFRKGKQVVL